jgi:hypothetical protein
MRALVEEFRQRLLFGTPHVHGIAVHDARDFGIRVVHVADEDRFDRADDDAGGFESHVDAVRAEVALLRRVVFRVDEDGIVRAGGHARLAADADRLIEIDDAVVAFEHRARRAGRHARRMRALVAARHLMRPARLRIFADIDMLDIGARHRDRHEIFRLAGGRTGMATDTARLIDDLSPARRLHDCAPVHGLLFHSHLPGEARISFRKIEPTDYTETHSLHSEAQFERRRDHPPYHNRHFRGGSRRFNNSINTFG